MSGANASGGGVTLVVHILGAGAWEDSRVRTLDDVTLRRSNRHAVRDLILSGVGDYHMRLRELTGG